MFFMFIGVYWFHVASWEKVFEMANYRGNSYKKKRAIPMNHTLFSYLSSYLQLLNFLENKFHCISNG